MKGIVFNLLEETVRDAHGEDAWDAILDRAGLDGAYTALGSYDDGELIALVGAGSELLGEQPDDIVRWFGREAMPLLAVRYPQLFEPHHSTRSLLLALNDIIHPEVQKLYPGAATPFFEYGETGDGVLELVYRSDRRMCSFAEGLIEGAAIHYGENVTINQRLCMKRGDDHCVIEVSSGD